MSSPKITTWIACLAFLYAGIPGLAQEVRHSGTVVGYGNTGSLQAEGNYDEPPLFAADGQAALEQWLAENITYPTTGFENGLHGEVTVRFTVEPDGSLDGIEATAYDDAALAAEAVAALHRSPRWLPGRKGGEPVAVTVTLPVSFRNAIRPKEAVFAAGDSQPADFMGGGPDSFPLLGHVQSGVPHRRIRQQYRRDGSRPFRHRHGGMPDRCACRRIAPLLPDTGGAAGAPHVAAMGAGPTGR